MNAQEIREKGKLVKSWRRMDGSWYEDKYEIYQVGDKFYQIKDHVCVTSGGSMSYWGRVTEVAFTGPLPTHLAIIIGQRLGEAFIAAQRQGTAEELAEWAAEYMKENEIGRYTRKPQHLTLKMVPLEF